MAALRNVAVALAFALALALGSGVPARAQGGGDREASAPPAREASATTEAQRLIDEARRLYQELEFALAIDAAQRALATPGIRDADRASALETLGSALLVLEREGPARDAFQSLFRLDPYWVVRDPSGSPRIRRFVEAVRATVAPDAALDPDLELRLELPSAARAQQAIAMQVRAEGGAPARVIVRARGEGELDWSSAEARREGARFAIELPARAHAEELELYAEARDAQGRVIGRAGGPLVPYRLPVREGTAPGGGGGGSILEEWWLWAAIGGAVVVIGAGIAIGVAAGGPQRAEPGTLPPNRVELPLVRF